MKNLKSKIAMFSMYILSAVICNIIQSDINAFAWAISTILGLISGSLYDYYKID